MEDEVNKQVNKLKKPRSASYPGIKLSKAVDTLRKLHDQLGSGPYDRNSAAIAMGYAGINGISATRIAALVHYGMLKRVSGGGYQETDLGKHLANPMDNKEEVENLRKAFKSPHLFAQLINEFDGKALPYKLDIILSRQYKITEQASSDVAKIFRESAETSGVLKNGFLNTTDDLPLASDKNSSLQSSNPSDSPQQFHEPILQVAPITGISNETIIPAKNGARLVIPEKLVTLALMNNKGFQVAIDALDAITDELEKLRPEKVGDENAGKDQLQISH